jgi:hypothetical protein
MQKSMYISLEMYVINDAERRHGLVRLEAYPTLSTLVYTRTSQSLSLSLPRACMNAKITSEAVT